MEMRLRRSLRHLLLLLAVASPGAVRAEADSTWTVMSFNMRYAGGDAGEHAWEARRAAVAERIQADGADLVATQECLAVQAEDLRRLLPDYALAGAGRDDGDQAGEMCAILWRRDRFHKLEEGHRWHGDDPFTPGLKDADAACVRIFSWVLLAERAAPHRRVALVDTHLDHVGGQARLRAARRLREWLATAFPDTPVILAGDFNCAAGEGTEPWRLLTDPATPRPLVDAFRALHPAGALPEGTFHGFRAEDQPGRIDWILASPELRPLEVWIDRVRVDGKQPSDHHPVVARFLPPAAMP
jgi:endonuclease/exonuclease/phosphatase family metal-dependent hydrolase